MKSPLVSIIIPVYNAEAYLSEAIISAINQTYSNKEIIVIDDGSIDKSLVIARSFESENLTVFSQKKQGASAARNLGLKHANGDFIQFFDADDLLSPNKIEAQICLLKDFPNHIGLCGTVYFNDSQRLVTQRLIHPGYSEGSEDPVDFLIKLYGGDLIQRGFGGMVQTNAWLTPRKIIDKAGLWNTTITVDDDGEFFCRVVLASKGIRYSKEATNYYRKHPDFNSLSGRSTFEDFRNMLNGNKLKLRYLLSYTNNPQAKLVMCRIFWENCFTFYPFHKKLAFEASTIAKSLDSSFDYRPYDGVKYYLAAIIGWKRVKILQFLKHILLLRFGFRN